jgi:mono/diheme cytochrome c family protein
LLLVLLGAPALRGAEAANAREFFELKVRPVLVKNCFACHTSARMGGLEMKSREALLEGGKDGPVIVPGEPEKSLLIQAIEQTHPRIKMPPGGKLKEEEIQDLVTWVKNGAVWPEGGPPVTSSMPVITAKQRAYWAFQPVRKPALPAVKDKSWPKAPIDSFILAALEKRGLEPNKPADKRTLIRRAYFDLIGLPPTPEEIDAFVKDSSRDALAKVVDRLLASPRYGERWGRHWLDVARYSDDKLNSTKDEPVPNAYRYRDWVIQAFNDDMPYDRFIEAQIAGDLLPAPAQERTKLVAGLGFYALSPEFQDDRVDATTRGFLALTVACAQCHDHKYDPISQEEYFRFRAFFEPLELRQDRVAGEADPGPFQKYEYTVLRKVVKNGLIRVLDEKLYAKTYVYASVD